MIFGIAHRPPRPSSCNPAAEVGAPPEYESRIFVDEPVEPFAAEDLDSFHDLMRRVSEGSQDAFWELVERYGGYLRRAVRRVLDGRLRSKFDSLDFVQMVWKSFVRMQGQADRFERPQHLAKFLVGMATNKVHMEARSWLATEKHDVQREVPLHHASGKVRKEMTGREPDPVETVIAQERLEQLLQNMPPHYRRIVELKSEEHTSAEIARILHLDPQTVRRFLKALSDATDP